MIANLLGVPETPGVTDVLAGSCSFENAVVRLEPFPNLYFLPAGKAGNNRTEWLTSQRWKALCDEFRSRAAYTILDGPPVDAVAEYRLLEEQSDGLLLVIRPDHTDRSLLYRTLESIPKKKLIGGVINSFRESLFVKPSSYHSYYSSQEQK